jgi:hypothetical protein
LCGCNDHDNLDNDYIHNYNNNNQYDYDNFVSHRNLHMAVHRRNLGRAAP